MAFDRIVFNKGAFGAILRSDEVKADLLRRAQAIANAAGPGFLVDLDKGASGSGPLRGKGGRFRSGGGRARASVRTGTIEAIRAQRRSRALNRAIDAGRG